MEEDITSEEFSFDGLEYEMEGKFRKGHFNGVGTIVKKLFEMVEPDKAFFGEKDYQQLQIIRKLVEKHQLNGRDHWLSQFTGKLTVWQEVPAMKGYLRRTTNSSIHL